MLSRKLLNQFKAIAKGIRRNQEQFVELYSAAVVEVAGKNWKRGDIATFFETVQAELKTTLVDAELMAHSVFYAYCHASRIALLFDVPFTIAYRVTAHDLPAVKQLVEADRSNDPKPAKFIRAARKVSEDRKADILATGAAPGLPLPEKGESPDCYTYRVCKMLIQFGKLKSVSKHAGQELAEIVEYATSVVAMIEAKQARKRLVKNSRKPLAKVS